MDFLDRLLAEGDIDKLLEATQEKPSSIPLGQGKNLKALERLSKDLGSKSKPYNYVPNFEMVGQPTDLATTTDLVPSGPRMPTVQGATDLIPASAGEVIPTTARQVGGEAAESTLDKFARFAGKNASKIGGKALKFATNPYVDTAAGLMASDDVNTMANPDQVSIENPSVLPAYSFLNENINRMFAGNRPPVQPPLAQNIENVKPEEQKEEQLTAAPETKAQKTETEGQAPTSMSDSVSTEQATEEKTPEEIYADRLGGAQTAANNQKFYNDLYRAGVMGAAQMAGTKADYSLADSLDKRPGEMLEGSKNRFEASKEAREGKSMQELRDPNSGLSKQARETYKKITGRDLDSKISAYQLGKAGVNLNTLLGHEENQEARRESAAARKELKELEVERRKQEKEDKKQQRQDELNDKWIENSYKALEKPYKAYQKIQGISDRTAQTLAGKPNGAKDIAMLYDFVKTLDNESAVREGEIKLSQQGMSALGALKARIANVTSGQILDPKFRKQVNDMIQMVKGDLEQNYADYRDTKYADARRRGISDENFSSFDPSIARLKAKEAKIAKGQPQASAPAAEQTNDPKIDKYAKEHGLDYKKAEAILRSRGYGKQ